MLKADIVRRVQATTGSTMKEANAAVEEVFRAISDALSNGEQVNITGFGKFLIRNRRARSGVNPRNPSERIQLPESIVPAFKAGKTLKDRVTKK
jgi:DNA-binding protein HU-beta